MVLVKRLDPNVKLPVRKTKGAAGLDLHIPFDFTIKRGQVANISLGIAVKVPDGFVGRLHGRSSLESRGLHVLAGVIDSDYTGELGVVFKNLGVADVKLEKHDRVAQLLIQPVYLSEVVEVWDLGKTGRGDGGFGSTGKK